MRPATAERIAQLLERRRQKQWKEDHRPPRGHRFEGRIFLGYLVAIEVIDQSPRDGTNTWLVWNLKIDNAELWRSCDLSRILRTDGKVKQNKCRYNSYWALSDNGKDRWYGVMYHAKLRLEGFKHGETQDEFYERVGCDLPELTFEQKMEIYGKNHKRNQWKYTEEDNDE